MKNRIVRWTLAVLILPLSVGAAWGVRLLVYHNFATVEANRVYRSSQMEGSDLKTLASDLKLKSIINLRGTHPKLKWYQDEIQASQAMGINHYDIKLNAEELPPPNQIKLLLQVFDEAPYPILIHCKAGADRTGLASALYLIEKKHLDVDSASDQLTWKLGHVPVGNTDAMDLFIETYSKNKNGLSVREWVDKEYPQFYKKLSGT